MKFRHNAALGRDAATAHVGLSGPKIRQDSNAHGSRRLLHLRRKTYLLLAVAGRTAAVVPIVRAYTGGYARRLRGDVVIDPVACGVPYRAAAARCAACCQVPTFDAEVTGHVSDADLRAMVDAVRRLNVSVQVEQRAAVM